MAGGIASVAAGGYLYAVDPNETGHFLACPLYTVTGMYCPACGGLRAVHALLHGDLATAMDRHPLVIPLFALSVALLLTALWRRRRDPEAVALPAGAGRWALGLVVVFTVARNIPGWTVLSPA